jgi:hypothetical protein
VAASFVAVLLWSVPGRLLKAAALALAGLALGAWIVFVFEPTLELAVAAAGLTACAAAELGAFVLAGALQRRRDVDEDLAEAEGRLSRLVEEETDRRAEELHRTLARARADSSSLLAEEERKLAAERHRLVAEREEQARIELAEALTLAQRRAEQRVAALAGDLEQLQQSFKDEIKRLGERQAQVMSEAEKRVESDRNRLETAHEEQRLALARVRTELAETTEAAFAAAKTEIEEHAAERRRALHEVAERLRRRERELQEQIERGENEAAQRIKASFTDVERRQLDQLSRMVDRAGERYVESAEQQFDASIRGARDEASRRLARELERASAMFAREAESVLAERLTKIGDMGAQRLERRLTDGETALGRRRDEILTGLEQRLADAEADLRRRIQALETALSEAEHRLGSAVRSS